MENNLSFTNNLFYNHFAIKESSIPFSSLPNWDSSLNLPTILSAQKKKMMLNPITEQKNMLTCHLIITPVREENTPEEIVVAIIILESCPPVMCRLNSLLREIRRGKSGARLMPQSMQQRYVAVRGYEPMMNNTQMPPESICPQFIMVNLATSLLLTSPNAKRKMVLRIQKREVNCTAYFLDFIPVRTAQEGTQLPIVTSIPMYMKKPTVSRIYSVFEIYFFQVGVGRSYICYGGRRGLIQGDLRMWKAGVSMRQAIARQTKISCWKIPTKRGAVSAPTPKTPCENDIHNPMSYLGGARRRQTLTVMTSTSANMFRSAKMRHWVSLVRAKAIAKLKRVIPRRQTMQMVWYCGMKREDSRALQRTAAARQPMEMRTKMREYYVYSMWRSQARKGMREPKLVKVIPIRKKEDMQRSKQLLMILGMNQQLTNVVGSKYNSMDDRMKKLYYLRNHISSFPKLFSQLFMSMHHLSSFLIIIQTILVSRRAFQIACAIKIIIIISNIISQNKLNFPVPYYYVQNLAESKTSLFNLCLLIPILYFVFND